MSRYRKTVMCDVRGCHRSVGAEGSAVRFPDADARRGYVEATTQRLLEEHYATAHPTKAPPVPARQKVLA